jgi:predicted dehydrogenase
VQAVQALGVSVFGGHEDVANARVVFADGCVATLTASRASAAPVRRLHVWAPEGYAGVDLAARTLSFVQPSAELRRLRQLPLGADTCPVRRKESAERHLESFHLERKEGDQLTAELRHFVDAVQHNRAPRVGAVEGHRAMALADHVLGAIRSHPWTANGDGPVGPLQTPAPLGPLFRATDAKAA